MWEQKHPGKIDALPEAVWRDFSEAFPLRRLPKNGGSNFGFRH
jgi:hypothetical protein